jgi:3' terminal RNA ribose 2'-O-methyltransferase Hen1
MLLTVTTTHQPATDLGYLLHKHPESHQVFELAAGAAHVFYPEASADRCTAALLLDVDPIALMRSARRQSLRQYVNDRPYVASSLLSSALARVFGTAMSGTCRQRPELAASPIPLVARLSAVPCRGGEPMLRRLFEPLGYEVTATTHRLSERFPDWGDAPHLTVELRATLRLAQLLSHLYVLVPTLDRDKHYWIGRDEVDKLLHRGGDWLAGHPDRELIVNRYLHGLRGLTSEALDRLVAEDAEPEEDEPADEADEPVAEAGEAPRPVRLHALRMQAAADVLGAAGARRVLDLGCGSGRLLRLLAANPQFEEIVGMDVSTRALATARSRLRLDRLPEAQAARLRLLHGSLVYRDERLAGFDGAAVAEVVEHLDPPRLAAFERALFAFARPRVVALTTPNAEYNVRWETLPQGQLRHGDHRFEWTRSEFEAWACAVAGRHGYQVRFEGIGPADEEVGAPSQMGVFTR